jgi:hypothetical protein
MGQRRVQIIAPAIWRAPLPIWSQDHPGQAGEDGPMAKGQMRSNTEIKKPKKEKPKAAVVVVANSAARISASQDKNKG